MTSDPLWLPGDCIAVNPEVGVRRRLVETKGECWEKEAELQMLRFSLGGFRIRRDKEGSECSRMFKDRSEWI